MTIKLINQTDYANIYGLYDATGKPIGTKEQRLAGRDVGTYYYSLTSATRAEVKKLFAQAAKQASASTHTSDGQPHQNTTNTGGMKYYNMTASELKGRKEQ